MRAQSEPWDGKGVIITGGLGFIGSNLARRLAALGARVLLVDSLIPAYGGNWQNIADIEGRVTVNISDVRDPHSLRHLVRDREVLFNLAGQTSHLDSMHDPYTDLDINVRAQICILDACRHYNPEIKIVFASTRQIYGCPAYLPVDERHPLLPVDVNGVNKLAGEYYHLLYGRVYGLRTCALRMTNTYGPRMRIRDSRQTFLGVWIRCLLEGRAFEVWGGKQRRDFNYIDDAVEAFLLAALAERAEGRVYNLGSSEVMTLQELADLLVKIHGSGSYEQRDFPTERKRIDIGDYYGDFQRIKEDLGWQPRVPLAEGLRKTLAYFKEHLPAYVS